MRKKQAGINPALEEAISKLLAEVMADPQASMVDKTRVIDRALKLEAIRLKADDAAWGSGFMNHDEDEES
jgi:hypothetical protein